jgi:hypothetical protein
MCHFPKSRVIQMQLECVGQEYWQRNPLRAATGRVGGIIIAPWRRVGLLPRATIEQVIPHEYIDSQNSPIAEVNG